MPLPCVEKLSYAAKIALAENDLLMAMSGMATSREYFPCLSKTIPTIQFRWLLKLGVGKQPYLTWSACQVAGSIPDNTCAP